MVIDVLHSNLNDTQRLAVWQRARTGQSAVVIGTRSALFTQFADLGLIVIDEEHDASFKQQDNFRYHARDLSVVLAKQLNIPVLMGSATPSLESLNNVHNGKYRHIILSNRAGNAALLRHSVIDLKQQVVRNGLSEALLQRMEKHLQKGNQVLLFLNRRGFAPVMLCHECGWIAECQHCEKPYTYHQHQRALRCHHCAAQKPIPRQCEHCGSTHLITTGLGTEQLEQTLASRFPQYQITRIDRDSTARKGKLEDYLTDIQQGKSQILIGTQMLAKGHHFPNVTLVALVNVDSALFSLDFRAEERLAQLYVQVAGRAGRVEKQGEVVLQTHYPDHPLLQRLLQQGYADFAEYALQLRQKMGLPPFSAQALFKAQSRHSEDAEQVLQQVAEYFYTWNQSSQCAIQILGPIAAPFSKKAGQYRWQLLLQHPSRAQLHHALSAFQATSTIKFGSVRCVLDVDPIDLN
ncbi:primosome assembly protein PriA [Pasteurella multocida subsp. multocida str. Anand1_buffalo]|nr:primosome assembly protein PriA [Pasteurella multocida subsp. multocida str. Anand1_buffalo]